jgi:hypothetical protein
MSLSIPMTRNNRVNILRRAREIISDRTRWTSGALRKGIGFNDSFCLLGACEQAVYDLGLAKRDSTAFMAKKGQINAYELGRQLQLTEFSKKTRGGKKPDLVNDEDGYEATLRLLDDYLQVVRG